jgi:hypothetical protein
MGLFANIGLNRVAISGGGGVYLEPGEYLLEIETLKSVKTRSKGPMFVADFKVLESTNETRPAGTRANYTVLTDLDWGPANLKEFLVAASGLDPFSPADATKVAAENWDAMLEAAISDAQPYKGLKIRSLAREQKTTSAQAKRASFTKIMFYPDMSTRKHFKVDEKKK